MPTLTRHSLSHGRIWVVAGLALVLIVAHGSVLYYAYSHMKLSAGILAGIVVLVVIKHLGLFGPIFAVFRRHRRRR